MIKYIVNILLPKTTWRRKLVKKILIKLRLKSPVIAGFYNTWVQQQRNQPILREELQDVSGGPLISIIVPTYNTPQRYLDDLVYSIISQAYENWELILTDASTDIECKNNIKKCADHDQRIRVFSNTTKGISANTNYGIKKAKGSYIAFCDHDDILEPFALYEVALRIIKDQADLIYTDEDKVSDDGEVYYDPHYKPDWSPDLLTHVNYITHLTVVKKKLLDKVGLLDSTKDGAQDYDLLLRLMDESPKVVHIAKVLYHWRAALNSTAQDFSSKKNITDAAKSSLEAHFKRNGIKVKAVPKPHQPGFYELQFRTPRAVSIIVTTFSSDGLLRLFIEILSLKTDFGMAQFELIVPIGLAPKLKHKNLKVIEVEPGSEYLYKATKAASSDTLIIINQVAVPNKKDWALRLTSMLTQQHIRVVSPVLVRYGSLIADCGLVQDGFDNYIHLFKDAAFYNNQTFFGNTNWVRNVGALTGGVASVRTDQFKAFMSSYEDKDSKAVFKFSCMGDFNTIYTEVVLDTYAIELPPYKKHVKFFNDNLTALGLDYIPHTPEASALNILLRVAEDEGIKV